MSYICSVCFEEPATVQCRACKTKHGSIPWFCLECGEFVHRKGARKEHTLALIPDGAAAGETKKAKKSKKEKKRKRGTEGGDEGSEERVQVPFPTKEKEEHTLELVPDDQLAAAGETKKAKKSKKEKKEEKRKRATEGGAEQVPSPTKDGSIKGADVRTKKAKQVAEEKASTPVRSSKGADAPTKEVQSKGDVVGGGASSSVPAAGAAGAATAPEAPKHKDKVGDKYRTEKEIVMEGVALDGGAYFPPTPVTDFAKAYGALPSLTAITLSNQHVTDFAKTHCARLFLHSKYYSRKLLDPTPAA
jgi:hypothetical protein